MKKYVIFLVISLLFFSVHFRAQPPKYRQSSDFEQAAYNVGFSAIVSAVGAAINKKPDEEFGKVLLKGLYQGALGGYVTFESKRILRAAERSESWEMIWCAKVVNAAGTSFKENAASNRDFWEKLHINIGFNRIEFDTKDRFKASYKVMPIELVYTIGAASSGKTKFDLSKSLKTGEFVFVSDNYRWYNGNEAVGVGIAYPGNIVLRKGYEKDFEEYEVITHEIIHIYQFNDFSSFDSYLNKPIYALNSKSEFMNKIDKYIHYDLKCAFMGFSYFVIEGGKKNHYYYNNFYEYEAGLYSGSLPK